MSKHHYLNAGSYRHYSSDLLKNQIENALGRAGPALDNWDLAGMSAHPAGAVSEGSVAHSLAGAIQGAAEASPFGQDIQQEVYRNARQAIELSAEMEDLKNWHENALLSEYTKDKLNEKNIETIVSDYT